MKIQGIVKVQEQLNLKTKEKIGRISPVQHLSCA